MARSWGKRSKAALDTADPRLVEVHDEALKLIDHTVTEGHRNKEDQNAAFDSKRSTIRWPNGNHNSFPSTATDSYPYPVELKEMNDIEALIDEYREAKHINADIIHGGLLAMMRQSYLKGIMMGIAHERGYRFRSGMDWDRDGEFKDHKFFDAPHIEVQDD